LQEFPEVVIKDKKRLFSADERYVVWVRADRHCQNCDKTLATLSEMAADHVAQWVHGGQTRLENARCLCPECNEKLKKKVA
jgi:5-methylcytosine-specific restriction endonuclease McrA